MPRLNVHQTHLESLVFTGLDGLNEIQDKVEKFIDQFSNDANDLTQTVKIDGAPAVIIWSSFAGYPNNSICLKSFVNSADNCLTSEEDINNKYKNQPDLVDKLKWALSIAQYIPEGEAWQGDCLFTKRTLEEVNILGKDYLVFQPNKLIYAFDENSDNFNKIKNADFGICFHTIYKGTLYSKSQYFNVNLNRLQVPSNIYLMSPNIEVEEKDENVEQVKNSLDYFKQLKEYLKDNDDYNQLCNNQIFLKYWSLYENNNFASHSTVELDAKDLISDLKSFIIEKLTKELNKKQTSLKTQKGLDRAREKFELDSSELTSLIDNNKTLILRLVSCFNLVAEIKQSMLEFYKKINFDYDLFYKSTSQGYIPAQFEGISLSTDDGDIVKLVDRSKFSFYNRNSDIESGFLHESLEDDIAVCAFGRMNPITIGHQKLVDTMLKIPGHKLLYLSHTQNKKKDPLNYNQKLKWAKKIFEGKVNVIDSPAINMFYMLHEIYEEGYKKIVYVCGEDRYDEMISVLNKYNGYDTSAKDAYYSFDEISVVCAGQRNEDSLDEVSSASATKARKFALDGDFENFAKIVPLSIEDAKEMFNEVRLGLGLTSIYEALDLSNRQTIMTDLRTLFKETLSEDLIATNKSSARDEIYRIKPANIFKDTGSTLEEYTKEKIEDLINQVNNQQNKHLKKSNLDIVDMSIEDYQVYGYEAQVSRSYKSFKLNFLLQNQDGEEDNFIAYITNSLGIKKSLTPNKVLKETTKVPYDEMINQIEIASENSNSSNDVDSSLDITKNFIASIFEQAANSNNVTYSGTYEDIDTGNFKFTLKLDDIVTKRIKEFNNNSLVIDLSEVFGGIAFSNAITQDTHTMSYLTYPNESNAKLIDYIIDNSTKGGDLRISAKVGQGLKPSSSSLVESILKRWPDHLDNNSDCNDGYNFVKWIDKNVMQVTVQNGFDNLKNLLIDLNSGSFNDTWTHLLTIPSGLNDVVNFEINSIKDANLLKDKCKAILSQYGVTLKSLVTEDIIDRLNNNSDDLRQWCDTVRIRYLSTIMIAIINNSDLINQVNKLFRLSFGSFVQVHMSKDKIEQGEFDFTLKTLQTNEYIFQINCGIDRSSLKMTAQKLAMVLK